MNSIDLELTRLIGDKTLSFGCWFKTKAMTFPSRYVGSVGTRTFFAHKNGSTDSCVFKEGEIEIIGHIPTIGDLHLWLNDYINFPSGSDKDWIHKPHKISLFYDDWRRDITIPYDSSKSLLDQSEETLKEIINLINSHS